MVNIDLGALWFRVGGLAIPVILFQVLIANVDLQKTTKRRIQHALTGHALVQISYGMENERDLVIALLGLGAVGISILQGYFQGRLMP